LILLGTPVPLSAQDYSGVDLNVCNKGTVPVEVVYARQPGVIHRDIMPENVLLSGSAPRP
jgi:serine/threonine protein kinase